MDDYDDLDYDGHEMLLVNSPQDSGERVVLSDEDFEKELAKLSGALSAHAGALEQEVADAIRSRDAAAQQLDENEGRLDALLATHVSLMAQSDSAASLLVDKQKEHAAAQAAHAVAVAHMDEVVEQQAMLAYNMSDMLAHAETDERLLHAIGQHSSHLRSYIGSLHGELKALQEATALSDEKESILSESLAHAQKHAQSVSEELIATEPLALEVDKKLAIERGKFESIEAEVAALAQQERSLILTRMVVMGGAAVAGITLGVLTFGIASGLAAGAGSLSSIYLTTLIDNARHLRENAFEQLVQVRQNVLRLQEEKEAVDTQRSKLFHAQTAARGAVDASRCELDVFVEQAAVQRAAVDVKQMRIATLSELYSVMQKSIATNSPRTVVTKLSEKLSDAKESLSAWRQQRNLHEQEFRRLRQEAREISVRMDQLHFQRRLVDEDKKKAVEDLVAQNNVFGKRSQFALLKENQFKAFMKVVENVNSAIAEFKSTATKTISNIRQRSKLSNKST